MKKRVVSLLLMMFMICIMTGCGSNKAKDAAEVFARSQEISNSAKSMDAKANMKLSMASGEESIDLNMDMDMSVFTDPIKAKINMTMDMGTLGKQDSDIYMVSEDGNFYTYTGMDGAWYKQEMDQELYEQSINGYDSSAYIDALVECADNFEMEEVEENGKKIYKVQGVVTGDAMKKLMESMQGMDQLGSLLQNGSLLDDMGSLNMTVYIDRESYTIDKISMDMTDMMAKIMENAMSEAGSDETLTINTCIMDMEYISYNSSEDFQLPEEAKNAEEIDMSSLEE